MIAAQGPRAPQSPPVLDTTRWLAAMAIVRTAIQRESEPPADTLVATDIEPDQYAEYLDGYLADQLWREHIRYTDYRRLHPEDQDELHQAWVDEVWVPHCRDADLVLVCSGDGREWWVDLNNKTIDGQDVPEETMRG